MCGRFNVDTHNPEIEHMLNELPANAPAVKSGEVFPTNVALTLIRNNGKTEPHSMIWGFPHWNSKGVIFNARTETVLAKRMFKTALLTHPAVIPTTGFYEWQHGPGKNSQKYIFRAPGEDILYLAGFWNVFGSGSERRFTILTTAANEWMSPYHSRMPLTLRPENLAGWLTGADRDRLLNETPCELAAQRA